MRYVDACGLDLLCHEALRDDTPTPPRRHSASRVRFDITPSTHNVECAQVILSNDPKDGWESLQIFDIGPAEQRYDQLLNSRIELASFNRERNTPTRRYGEPSPVVAYKRGTHGADHAKCSGLSRCQGHAPAAVHQACSAQPYAYIPGLTDQGEAAQNDDARATGDGCG